MANTLYCSFCGKSQHEVDKLIAGPTVFICDECVDTCVRVVGQKVHHRIVDMARLSSAMRHLLSLFGGPANDGEPIVREARAALAAYEETDVAIAIAEGITVAECPATKQARDAIAEAEGR